MRASTLLLPMLLTACATTPAPVLAPPPPPWIVAPATRPGAAPTTFAAVFIAATPYPTVSSDTVEVRANGTWAIAQRQSLRVSYSYLYMTSSDWMYEGMQLGTGTLSGVLPSNEQPFNYKVHAVGVSYLVSF